jgi:transcriptional regulator with XRE-family HTH domain
VVAGRNDKSGKPPPNAPAGETSKRIRRQKGLTQEQLAELSGFSQQYISGLEQGRRNPTAVSLYELATALGVGHMELMRSAEDE